MLPVVCAWPAAARSAQTHRLMTSMTAMMGARDVFRLRLISGLSFLNGPTDLNRDLRIRTPQMGAMLFAEDDWICGYEPRAVMQSRRVLGRRF